MGQISQPIYEFDGFRLDTGKRLLWREGKAVALTSKCFETLLALVESQGETVDKDALLSRVWPDTVVEEKNLTINISTLRKALGESPQEHRYIVTVPGRGYRFVAASREVTNGEAELIVQQSTVRMVVEEEEDLETTQGRKDTATKSLPVAQSPRRLVTRIAISIALLAMLIIGVAYWWRARESAIRIAGGPQPAIQSLAVLPFTSLNSQGSEDYLGIGMADVTITRLGSLNQLVVRPTRSVLRFAAQDPLQAGQALKVDAVLDGSIQQVGERLRVTLRLLRVADGRSLWTDQFDERGTDTFALQDAISRKVTEALALQLNSAQQQQLAKRYTDNTDAYRAYLKGRYYRNRFTPEGYQQAIASFNEAISLDHDYALAWAGLADTYYWAANFYLPGPEAMTKAKEAAQRALALDEQLAEAHLSLGQVRYVYDWQFADAEQHFKRALALKPGLAEAHLWYGEYLAEMGRDDDGLVEMKRAEQIDPLSPLTETTVGLPHFLAGRDDEAVAVNLRALELNPNAALIHLNLGITYAHKGEGAKGIAEFQRAIQLGANRPDNYAFLAYGYACAGNRAAAEQTLAQVFNSPGTPPASYNVAMVYIVLGDKEQAFVWLEKAYRERSEYMVWLKTDPRLNSLRNDPRFSDLLRRVGLL